LLRAFVLRRVLVLRAPARPRVLELERDVLERDVLERDVLERDEGLRVVDIGAALRVAFLRLFLAALFFGDFETARTLRPTATAGFRRVTFLLLRPTLGLPCVRFAFLEALLTYFRP
jgi:hypothetical protein